MNRVTTFYIKESIESSKPLLRYAKALRNFVDYHKNRK